MKHKNLIIGVVVLIVIAIVIIIAFIKLNPRPGEAQTNMTNNELIGKWNAISEETVGEISNLSGVGEYSMTFNYDGSYFETIGNVNDRGLYKIDGENITLYNSPDDLKYPESLNKGWFKINGDELTLTLPKYPKIVVYRRG